MTPTVPANERVPESATFALKQHAARSLKTNINEISISPFATKKGIADETEKFRITDRRGRLLAVVFWSSTTAPNMVLRGVERARAAKSVLGATLGDVVLLPLDEGEHRARSFAVMPGMSPFAESRASGFLQRRCLGPSVLLWLREATARTRADQTPTARLEHFARPLEHIRTLDAMPAEVRERAGDALHRLSESTWTPSTVLMHGDLWTGNVLINPARKSRGSKRRFVIIDWAGSVAHGYALYDLVRFCSSLRCSRKKFRSELSHHVRILGCDEGDANSYLLAALGHIGINREHFPLDRYVKMSCACIRYLAESGK